MRDVAAQTKAPFVVLEKTRRGDRAVEISAAHLDAYRTHTPVLVDDIISTGTTMRATLAQLAAAGMPRGVCIGVHAVFAGNAYEELRAVAGRVVTCDTIEHPSNTIMLSDAIAAAVANNSQ